MKKIDSFFVLILFMISGLGLSYLAFDYHLSGVDFEKNKNRILEAKIEKLNLVVASLEKPAASVGRGIASIGPEKNITLDRLYIEQLRTARKEKNATKVLGLTEKLISASTDLEILAEANFAKAELSCLNYVVKENSCLSEIETLITQFPESVWAGEGLIVLSTVYSKQKRYKEASSILKIVKTEFNNQKRLLVKAENLEKSFL